MINKLTAMRSHARYWMTRLYVALSTLVSVVIILFEDESLVHVVTANSGTVGWACVATLGVLSMIAIADVVINDLLPEEYDFAVAKRNRHLVYMALAMGLMSLCFVMTKSKGEWTQVLLRFQLDAFVAATLAILDLFSRHRVNHGLSKNQARSFESSSFEG